MRSMNQLTELIAQQSPWKNPWSPTWTASPAIPALMGMVAILVVIVCYLSELREASLSRRAMFTLLRSTALLLLAWMLLGWSWTPYAEEPADIVLLVDSSRSMATEDVEPSLGVQGKKSISRWDAARALLSSTQQSGLLVELAKKYQPRIAHFDDHASWLPAVSSQLPQPAFPGTAEGTATKLGDAIHDALQFQSGRPAAAMVVVSDGIRTSGKTLSAAASEAKALGVPIYTIGIGVDRPTRDVRLTNLSYSSTAFLGDVVNIEADVESDGFPDQSLRVLLRRAKESEPLLMEPVKLRAGKASAHLRLPVRPTELGNWNFLIEITRPEGDLHPDNNQLSGAIHVQEETVRVLLLDRRPRYDVRYLVDLLTRARKRGAEKEPAFEVKIFLQEGDSGLSKQDSTALDAIPTSEELSKYDVIVLGDIDLQLLGVAAQRQLIEVVSRGGAGLVLLPAADAAYSRWENQPLEFLLPARAGDFRGISDAARFHNGVLTNAGKQIPFCFLGDKANQSDVVWKTLPTFIGLLSTSHLRPEVNVLVETRDQRLSDGRPAPIVTAHYVGAAFVLCHWTDEWWRWASPATRGYYDQYWMQAIRMLGAHKLAPSDQQFTLRTEEPRYEEGQSVKLSLHVQERVNAVSNDQGAIVSVRKEGFSREVALNQLADRQDLFRGTVDNLPAGVYEAELIRPSLGRGESKCVFEVTPRASESLRIQPDFDALRALASQTGGKFYTAAMSNRLIDDMPRGRAIRTMPLAPRSAWNLPVWAALFVIILSLEWFLRRAGGML